MRQILLLMLLSLTSLLAMAHSIPSSHLQYIENKGQWPSQVLYKADVPGGAAFLEKGGITYHLWENPFTEHAQAKKEAPQKGEVKKEVRLKGHAFKVNFIESNPNLKVSGGEKQDQYYNYFLGNDKRQWASKAGAYKIVHYHEIYNSIDLTVYSNSSNLKYDFIVKVGANPKNILMEFTGADNLLLRDGNLIITTSIGEIIEKKPFAYQIINGKKTPIPCEFLLVNNRLQFHFPHGYNQELELIIDPELMFSTFSGSFSNNFGYTATFDSDGFLYSGSTAFGTQYPTTLGAYDRTFNGGIVDIAITKYDTTGTMRIYSTYIGGNSDEMPHSLIVNSNDELYILGTTSSTNYPTTDDAFDSTFNGGTYLDLENGLGTIYTNGSDLIISQLSFDGSQLLASTYLGGSQNDGINILVPLGVTP
ncbi:MAG: hypothetical protein ACK4ND_04915, partial [Cytophagaceae bacterium]